MVYVIRDALGYGFGDSLLLSPLAESEDSVISELSSRADRTRSDALEIKDQENKDEDKPRPLHRTSRATSSDDLYEELEHIYEELDNYRSKSIVTPEQSDVSSTLKGGDTASDAEESSSGYAPIDEVIEHLKGPDVEQVEHQQQLQRPELMSSEYRPIARVRKAHPNGLVFPRITATVPTLPELPEEHEVTALPPPDDAGIKLTPETIPYADELPRLAVEHIMPSDLTSTKEESKRAELKSQAQVVADQHKLVIRGWESLISDSEESS
ncbi:hypothetical protein Y032_0650g1137 [Ancylostoma ceylanicum]|uniref:Uncharacterized protein n=1 Tax=Ancylostoma ceylanicum TaxID=53326 RepID=A0A016WKR4_9BILA|nr:hypothetical protein Y032_0650g1137 [Ancylostoma ceylanicum]